MRAAGMPYVRRYASSSCSAVPPVCSWSWARRSRSFLAGGADPGLVGGLLDDALADHPGEGGAVGGAGLATLDDLLPLGGGGVTLLQLGLARGGALLVEGVRVPLLAENGDLGVADLADLGLQLGDGDALAPDHGGGTGPGVGAAGGQQRGRDQGGGHEGERGATAAVQREPPGGIVRRCGDDGAT